MAKRRIIVMAPTRNAAIADAAKKLGVAAEELEAAPISKGQYACSVRPRTGVSVELRENGMEAVVTGVQETREGGLPGLADFRQAMEDEGIVFGIDDEALRGLAERVKAGGKVDQPVVVARGSPPRRVSGEYQMRAGNHERVRKGVDVAIKASDDSDSCGHLVTGKEVPPVIEELPEGARGLEFLDNIRAVEKGKRMVSDCVGTVVIEGSSCRLVPLVEVDATGLEARIHVFPPAEGQAPLSEEEMVELLRQHRVVFGLQPDLVRETLHKVREGGGAATGVVVARGVPPLHGVDGKVDYLIDLGAAIGLELDDGSIDYRERGTVKNVVHGQALMRISRAVKGTAGRAVSGQVIQARDGIPPELRPGENVELLEDGETLRATTDGCVLIRDGQVGVADIFETRGDVDYNTGNLDCTGVLRVNGSVRPGFTLKARREIQVLGTVEEAHLECGGDVFVQGGVLMRGGTEESRRMTVRRPASQRGAKPAEGASEAEPAAATRSSLVEAAGSVHISFATNAVIHAGRDLHVRNEAMNCRLEVEGRLLATEGKGVIIGGALRAAGGIEVRQLGSEAGIRTEVLIDTSPAVYREKKQCIADCERYEEEVAKIEKLAASGALKPHADMSAEKKQGIVKLLNHLKQVRLALDQAVARHGELEQRVAESRKAKVIVHGEVHPGVVLRFHDQQYRLEKRAKAYAFYWSDSEGQVMRTPVLELAAKEKAAAVAAAAAAAATTQAEGEPQA